MKTILVHITPDPAREGWYNTYSMSGPYASERGISVKDLGIVAEAAGWFDTPVYVGSYDNALYWVGVIKRGLEQTDRERQLVLMERHIALLRAEIEALRMEKALGKEHNDQQ